MGFARLTDLCTASFIKYSPDLGMRNEHFFIFTNNNIRLCCTNYLKKREIKRESLNGLRAQAKTEGAVVERGRELIRAVTGEQSELRSKIKSIIDLLGLIFRILQMLWKCHQECKR